jgi:sulfur carrier protein ThiS adenylyltransferase
VKEKKSPDIRSKAVEKKVSPSSRILLLKLKDLFKLNAHVIIYSGFPLSSGHFLKQRYEIGLIRKEEIPSLEEFESLLVARHTPKPTIKGTPYFDYCK